MPHHTLLADLAMWLSSQGGTATVTALGTFWLTQLSTDRRDERKSGRDRAERALTDVYAPVAAAYSRLSAQCETFRIYDERRVASLQKYGPPPAQEPVYNVSGGILHAPQLNPFDFGRWGEIRDQLMSELRSLCNLLSTKYALLEPSTRAIYSQLASFSELMSACKFERSPVGDTHYVLAQLLRELNDDVTAQEQKLRDRINPRPLLKRAYDFCKNKACQKRQDTSLQELAAALPDGQLAASPAIETSPNPPTDGATISAAPEKSFTKTT